MNKVAIRKILRRFGVDLCRRMPRVVDLLHSQGTKKVLDIGANTGQTGKHLRHWGYTGEIVSFEPVSSAFEDLQKAARDDPLWKVVNLGIGDRDDIVRMNISKRSDFSSIREGLPILWSFHAGSAYVQQQDITLRRIDTILPQFVSPEEQVFVKVDTQGYEREVLAGAMGSLQQIQGFQLELSLIPMYEGEGTFLEIAHLLAGRDYELALIEPVSYDTASNRLLQVDGFFVRR